jgi:predicted membrane channel-forming protein YqfA (hemolysin III family)
MPQPRRHNKKAWQQTPILYAISLRHSRTRNGWGKEKTHHRERLNAWPHLAGAILACSGAAWLQVTATRQGNPWKTTSVAIYGLTLVLLYRVFGDHEISPAETSYIGS